MDPLFSFIGLPGGVELVIVAVIVLLLFGNRVPSVMRSLGRSIIEFKKGVQGIEDEIEDAASKPAVTAKKDKATSTKAEGKDQMSPIE